MNMPVQPAVISSTKDLEPAKILGYAKGIAVTIGAILVAAAEAIPDTWPYKRYLQAAILICTIIGTIQVPNAVKPVVTVPVGQAQAEDVQVDAVVVPVDPAPDPEPLLGVVQPPEPEDPPGKHEAE